MGAKTQRSLEMEVPSQEWILASLLKSAFPNRVSQVALAGGGGGSFLRCALA